MKRGGVLLVKKEYTKKYTLDDQSVGYAELDDNCWNFSITVTNENDIYAEYIAGFIQGKLQKDLIKSARDNTWTNNYYCDPTHSFPKGIRPTREERNIAQNILSENYKSLCYFIKNSDSKYAIFFKRLLFRMLGIYHAIIYESPQTFPISEWLPTLDTFQPEELVLKYGTNSITFMDVYFINAQEDLQDVISNKMNNSSTIQNKSDHCSAFLKRMPDGEIYMTHNCWSGFLSQTHTISYCINGTFITQNTYCPGEFGSNTDFGFNGNGICFNETTHLADHIEPKIEGIWLCWRAAAAEIFSDSIDQFYQILSCDNTGTYLSGYMVMDVKTNETALIEMSYKRFVYFKSSGAKYDVIDSIDGLQTEDDYDKELICEEYIFGINYPVSYKVVDDLVSRDNRPMRRIQFKNNIHSVVDIHTTKKLITYTDPEEPLSIYGRWDLGYGTTDYPKTVPDGSIDAKACSSSMIRQFLNNFKKKPSKTSNKVSFWMKYGTPTINGYPFIWSKSQWKGQLLNNIPDKVDGDWHLTRVFMD